MKENDIKLIISKAKNEKWNVCLYGMGRIGQNCISEIRRLTGLRLTHVSDSNDAVILNISISGLQAITRNELINCRSVFLVIVSVGDKLINEIIEGLRDIESLYVISLADICGLDSTIDAFFGIHSRKVTSGTCIDRKIVTHANDSCNNRVAVYTCITGGYDETLNPEYISPKCDYYLISDAKPSTASIYNWIDVDEVVPLKNCDNKVKNRYCKTHGFSIFPAYEYSIYIDGNLQIVDDVVSFISYLGEIGLCFHKHPFRDCIYEEAIRAIWAERVDRDVTIRQMKKYAKCGMPRKFGLFECGVIVCQHSCNLAKKILQMWFEDYLIYQTRDQLSLPFVLWSEGIPKEAVGLISDGINMRENHCLRFGETHENKTVF